MKNKIFLIILAFLLFSSQFDLIESHSINKKINFELNSLESTNLEKENYHIIEKFPYVSQKTNFYCTYACPTMILKYYGIDTDIFEVMFNSGVGYSLVYSHPSLKHFLLSCIATSNWESDRQFLAKINGLSYEEYRFYNQTYTEEEIWQKYWLKIKENIKNNTPIITISDPIYLKSIRKCIQKKLNLSDNIMEKIPEILWNFIPCFMNHMIIIIGYNEDNGTICFNDPSTEVFGFQEFGNYSWMDLTDFKNAMSALSKNQPYYSYFVGVFKNTSQDPLEKMDRFISSLNRNIERMIGNISQYDDYIVNIWNCSYLGIKGLEEYLKDITNNIYRKLTTIYLYKFITTYYLFSISYKLYYLFENLFPTVLDLNDYHSQMNYCYQLAVEKKDISNYLLDLQFIINNSTLSKICYNNSIVLKMESENFSKLAENFSKFLGHGFFIKNSNALNILENMEKIIYNLIYLENKIINIKYS